ncbi:O-antigen ligase family protein [Mycolicibacterium sp. 050158]|uniref:O-antigen ligase family protein n=1 Tax=Mycolicibacterium sp. 050158 TaxID=3090602 RepID=UPI00299DAB9D|nr:O-antigen ligase family protein [Mycolicibacterium sp. 050158]MDX1888202.1 hypothetical protein [Mycolicibacterium sp. 050158]
MTGGEALRNLRHKVARASPKNYVLLGVWVMVALLVAAAVRMANVSGLIAGLCGGAVMLVCWGRPRLAFCVWLTSVTMVPIWISVHVLANVPIHCVVAVMAVAATIGRSNVKFSVFDAYFIAFLTVAMLAVYLDNSNAALWAQMVVRWAIPFLAIRVLVSCTGMKFAVDAVAVAFALVGAFAVVEFVMAWHPFVNWNYYTPEFAAWHPIQTRGGLDRSEWAFGHSIALGGSLALSIPFILRSSFSRAWRALFLVFVVAGIVTTASRGSLIAAGLTGAICLIYASKQPAVRSTMVVLVLVSAMIVGPLIAPILQTWALGSSNEEQGSANYRNDLYSTYLPAIQWFGRSPSYHTDGSEAQSIDSAILRIGLEFGWLVLALALAPLVVVLVRVVLGRASTAEIGLLGQVPLFATVALITQYESIVFMVAGLAVQSAVVQRNKHVPAAAPMADRVDGVDLRRPKPLVAAYFERYE